LAVAPPAGPGGAAAASRSAAGVAKAAAQSSGTSAPQVQGSPSSPCLISWPSTSLPLVGSVGGGCILSKTNVRAMVGGLLLVAAGGAMLPAVIILAAAGFRQTGIAGKAANVAGAIPGGQGYAVALRTLQGGTGALPRTKRKQSRRKATAARQERQMERAVGEPRENPSLREGRGAVRETSAETRRRRAAADRPPF
jgi:hypothetical protein